MSGRGRAALVTIAVLVLLTSAVEADNEAPLATILCYHAVESPAKSRFSITPEDFLQQISYLIDTGYTIIPLADLVDYLEGKRDSLPPNAVVITVDDGWRSTYDIFFREFQRMDLPFTAFIYPKFVIGGEASLTWDQVREMADAGVDIQSHTLSHAFLTKGRSGRSGSDYYQWLMNELRTSKKILEERTGRPVRFLAYPYGDYDSIVADATRKAGYSAALTCNYGPVTRGADPYRLRRVVIDRATSFASFRRYLGASTLEITDIRPVPGRSWSPAYPVLGARLADPGSVDPSSVRMRLLGGVSLPFFYDPRNGSLSIVLKDDLPAGEHSVVVWATDNDTGRRLEASWSFRMKPASRSELATTAGSGKGPLHPPAASSNGSFE
jgi:peptidoglycan/xylan/chitin deacetylase (PgdA/CDA1 family)